MAVMKTKQAISTVDLQMSEQQTNAEIWEGSIHSMESEPSAERLREHPGRAKGTGRCFTPRQVDEIVRQYEEERICMSELAVRHGVCTNTIRLYLVEAGAYAPANPVSADREDLAHRGAVARRAKAEFRATGRPLCCEACGWRPPERFSSLINCHHIVPVHAGGGNHRGNLVLLCPNHHALAHAMFARSKRTYYGPTTKAELLEAIRDPDAYYEREAERIHQILG